MKILLVSGQMEWGVGVHPASGTTSRVLHRVVTVASRTPVLGIWGLRRTEWAQLSPEGSPWAPSLQVPARTMHPQFNLLRFFLG